MAKVRALDVSDDDLGVSRLCSSEVSYSRLLMIRNEEPLLSTVKSQLLAARKVSPVHSSKQLHLHAKPLDFNTRSRP